MTWTGDSVSSRRARLPEDWEENYRKPVLRRAKGLCQIKGPRCKRRATQVDHIQRGDDHSLSNLQAACPPCHHAKSAAEGVEARAKLARQRLRPVEAQPWAVRKPR